MGTFDDLAELIKKDPSNKEVDKIIEMAEARLASYSKSPIFESIKADLANLKANADKVKKNENTDHIDDLNNMKDLQTAVNKYHNRSLENGSTSCHKEIKLANKLADLAEKADGKETYKVAHALVQCSQFLSEGESNQREEIAGNICTAYACAIDNAKLSPEVSRAMLRDVNSMAFDTTVPDYAFGNIATNLDDRKTAEMFLNYTEKITERMDAECKDVYAADILIKAYSKIVKHHPDMAGKCNKLVNWFADSQGDSNSLGAAVEYFDMVKNAKDVSTVDMSMARVRSAGFSKKRDRKLELESKKAQTQQKTSNMEMDYSFDDYDYGY